MKLVELINIIEKAAPPHLAEPWDKSGPQVASFRTDISHVAVLLEPLAHNIRRALDLGADFILAHHPLDLRGRLPDRADDYHAALSALFKADVPLYSAHTSLDCNPAGPARWLAHKFSLREAQLLAETGRSLLPGLEDQGELPYGLGFIGDLPTPLPYAEFCRKLARLTERQVWRSCGPKPLQVSRLACCPGSGGELAPAALAGRADVFITGDLRYHTAVAAAPHMLDVGHFALEEIMMREFACLLQEAAGRTKVTFIPGEDPFLFERS